ncbi:TPA: conjugal transfer protein TraM [Legionella pneumophila]|nr:conjugal transfer protein TraM [Legionella pneumophila]
MSDKMNEAVQEIAVRHGVILGKDDPILILQTINEKLLEENRKAQQDMLVQFKEEMENISSQWKNDANEKAEKVLNAALTGSKDVMARLLQESTNEFACAMKKMMSDSLAEARAMSQQARKFSRFALLSSVFILAGSVLTFLMNKVS